MRTESDRLLTDVNLHAEVSRAIADGLHATKPGTRQHLDYVDRGITLLLGPEEEYGDVIVVNGDDIEEA